MKPLSYTLIKRCRGCRAANASLETVLQMEAMPLAGMFCPSREAALEAPVFPLTWMKCHQCGLLQVAEDIPDTLLFSKYQYASSKIGGLVKHFELYAAYLKNKYGDKPLRFCEIGCNDGVLLNRLPQTWKLAGVDPSDIAMRAAGDHSPYRLYQGSFSLDFVGRNHLENSFDVISGSNCLAHISDLRDVFEGVHQALRSGGHFWIEVHDLKALLNGAQWDTIYHEHKAEWSEESLLQCLAPLGFVHRETQKLSLHGGLLRLCFEKEDRAEIVHSAVKREPGLERLRAAYLARYETPAARQLISVSAKGGKIAAYGAAGRANVYLNQMKKIHFEYIVDEQPSRLNTFLPQIATPVVPPQALADRPVGHCLITAWNYREDIIRKNPQFKGEWLTAFGDLKP